MQPLQADGEIYVEVRYFVVDLARNSVGDVGILNVYGSIVVGEVLNLNLGLGCHVPELDFIVMQGDGESTVYVVIYFNFMEAAVLLVSKAMTSHVFRDITYIKHLKGNIRSENTRKIWEQAQINT